MKSWSLSLRLFVLTAIWAVIAVSLVAFLVSRTYRASMEETLDDRLTATLYNIMASIGFDAQGQLTGSPDLRDARFQAFNSGYYWSVSRVNGTANGLRSASLAGNSIEVPPGVEFDRSFERRFSTQDGAGNRLLGLESQVFLGEADDLVSFRITGNLGEVEEEVAGFTRQLLLMLGLFALGFIVVASLIVRIALAPLREATLRLADIREGRADAIESAFPREIQPFVDETNSLILSNRRVIERARTQVGNLAHSLKTPLAVLRNEARNFPEGSRDLVENQVDMMQRQVEAYLDRARIAAQAATIGTRTDVAPALQRLVRVLSKLNPGLEITLDDRLDGGGVFAGEQQDLEEMVGNLMENACKFARHRITVTIDRQESARLAILVRDDGPGMSAKEAQAAMKRGTRLDESKPGSGLGLSIVQDIAGEYMGSLQFGRSPDGGLECLLDLPSARSEAMAGRTGIMRRS